MKNTARILLVAGALVAGLGFTGCGARPQRTALAVEGARWDGSTLVVRTECSETLETDATPDRSDPSLYRISIYGEPTLGRCRPEIRYPAPPGVTKLLDVTTSQVIDLPKR